MSSGRLLDSISCGGLSRRRFARLAPSRLSVWPARRESIHGGSGSPSMARTVGQANEPHGTAGGGFFDKAIAGFCAQSSVRQHVPLCGEKARSNSRREIAFLSATTRARHGARRKSVATGGGGAVRPYGRPYEAWMPSRAPMDGFTACRPCGQPAQGAKPGEGFALCAIAVRAASPAASSHRRQVGVPASSAPARFSRRTATAR